jgi:predicted ester cyclase
MAQISDLEANKALVRRFFQDLDSVGVGRALDNNATADVVMHYPRGLSPEPLRRAAYETWAGQFLTAFADFRHIIADIIAEGDRVCVRGTDRGTHRGEFQGIAATGKEVAFSIMVVVRIENGKIAEMWAEGDMIGLLQQLGVQALPAGQATS